MSATASAGEGRWKGIWLDLAAFAGGLGMAWFAGWNTTDLIWSLWLASLVVGYASIVWMLSASLREFVGNAARGGSGSLTLVGGGAVVSVGFLVALAFFTIHFGGFHLVHSAFLAMFFPLEAGGVRAQVMPSLGLYAEVLGRYWIFLPLAFLAERSAFFPVRSEPAGEGLAPTPKAVPLSGDMMAPYRNVVRMHLLIFFFAGAHFAGLESFAVYAVVYAVYFFPWRILRREP